MIDIDNFVAKHVTRRETSLFQDDINKNFDLLNARINGSKVLVIGGAGSIGSSFIKEMLPFKPKKIVVVDINENGLTELTRDLRSSKEFDLPKAFKTYPINYAEDGFYKLFKYNAGFDIVANFSAHKHVRSEKDIFSIESLLFNNVINAKLLMDILNEFKPKHFFCVSTDKAANPVNVMGASKKIMEDLILSYSNSFPVTTARFANVAFSNGSLPEGFLNRISKKQPISAPKDVSRYFVSKKESGQICLLACIVGNSGDIYFPKLRKKQMMSFSTIAKNLLNEFGYEIDNCVDEKIALAKSKTFSKKYPVYFSKSNTSGEKLYEEFYTTSEKINFDKHLNLGVIISRSKRTKKEIDKLIIDLRSLFTYDNLEKKHVIKVLQDYLGNFNHIETGKSLDSKM